MNEELWKRLEDQAVWHLEHPDQMSPREHIQGMGLHLRLWRYPRSGPHVSWSIILPVREFRSRRALIREVVWDRLVDWKQRMTSLEALKRRQVLAPSVRCRDSELSWDDLAPFLDVAGGLRSPMPFRASSTPPREDSFGLEGHRSLLHLRLRWIGKGPRGWGDTIAWVGKLRELLIRSMRERDTHVRQG